MTTITYTSTYDGTVSPLHAERRDAVSACRQAATVVVHLQSQSVRGKENDRLLQVLWRGFGSCHRHNGRHDHLSTTRTAHRFPHDYETLGDVVVN